MTSTMRILSSCLLLVFFLSLSACTSDAHRGHKKESCVDWTTLDYLCRDRYVFKEELPAKDARPGATSSPAQGKITARKAGATSSPGQQDPHPAGTHFGACDSEDIINFTCH